MTCRRSEGSGGAAAIRSFFSYAAFELPEHAERIQRVLAIPARRCPHEQMHYLSRPEIDALLAAPDQNTHQARVAPCLAAYGRDGVATGRRRYDSHCAVVGP